MLSVHDKAVNMYILTGFESDLSITLTLVVLSDIVNISAALPPTTID